MCLMILVSISVLVILASQLQWLAFLSSVSWWDQESLSFRSGPKAVTLEHIDWLFDPILPPPPHSPSPPLISSGSSLSHSNRTWCAYKFRRRRGSNNTTVQCVPKPFPVTRAHSCVKRWQAERTRKYSNWSIWFYGYFTMLFYLCHL
jgi:hypothetical protein